MIAYKGFRPGMICIGYQFQMGLNVTEKANCRQNGFHCAEDPLDCLSYYSDVDHSEYYIVNAGGDIDEDEVDSKISCTELTVLKRLTKEELFLHGLAFFHQQDFLTAALTEQLHGGENARGPSADNENVCVHKIIHLSSW